MPTHRVDIVVDAEVVDIREVSLVPEDPTPKGLVNLPHQAHLEATVDIEEAPAKDLEVMYQEAIMEETTIPEEITAVTIGIITRDMPLKRRPLAFSLAGLRVEGLKHGGLTTR
jgi:hypothetical protein